MRAPACALAALALGCGPVDEPPCGSPSTVVEVTRQATEGGRTTTRRETTINTRDASARRVSDRVEDAAGRLLALEERPPSTPAPIGAAARSLVLAYDDDGRLTDGTLLYFDAAERVISSWQIALGYTGEGAIERIEAVGLPPPGTEVTDAAGLLIPGPSAGRLIWLPPLPGADLLGPLAADVQAVARSLPPGQPLGMIGDFTETRDGMRADWRVGGAGIEVPLTVTHVAEGDDWLRTWDGGDPGSVIAARWTDAGAAPGDGDLEYLLGGAVYQRTSTRTVEIEGGTRRTTTFSQDGTLAWSEVWDTRGEAVEIRFDANGDTAIDEVRARLPSGEGRVIEVIDVAPMGPVDQYAVVETDGSTRVVRTVVPRAGEQLCAVDGSPVVLAGAAGDLFVEGIPEALPPRPE